LPYNTQTISCTISIPHTVDTVRVSRLWPCNSLEDMMRI
jgi:hypothetical protein